MSRRNDLCGDFGALPSYVEQGHGPDGGGAPLESRSVCLPTPAQSCDDATAGYHDAAGSGGMVARKEEHWAKELRVQLRFD